MVFVEFEVFATVVFDELDVVVLALDELEAVF